MSTLHRKRKVVCNESGHAHFLTFSCQDRLPLLKNERACRWVIKELAEARRACDFDLWAWVIMPKHVHLLLRPRQPVYRMSRILQAIKRPVSSQAKRHLYASKNWKWLDRLTVQEGKEKVFRFWLAGGGYDESLTEEAAILEVIDYIHANPVRRGLVNLPLEWEWSSARFYAQDPAALLVMDPLIPWLGSVRG